ncbi:transglycosylase SLT domain-containing protein [Salmonella enterica subsp. enterica]|nr:lytic transglycosylase [Salmonella enterica subsp. enterica serovar Hvittingfoss]EDR5814857.1 transglycosylase SLT domain-containing protein [Salmonella enterica subsp. enterica serovar Soumbedioune]
MRSSIIALLFLMSAPVFAQDCFDRAGRDYGINSDLLRAISFRESSWRADALNIVSPESYAVGAMQIHSQNFAHLSRFGITPDKLTSNVCMNIYTGAYYLAIAFKRWGVNWRAIGAYNAGFRETDKQEMKRQKYAREVKVIYEKIVRSREKLTQKAS